MKNPLMTSVRATSALFAALGALSAQAATLYWDTNGGTAGAGVTADGTWDTGTTANWSTDSAGAIATTTFTAADDVVFSAGADTTTATITASGTPSAHSITIEEGSYSFSGNISLSSAANSGSLNVSSGAAANFANNITLLGNTAFAIEGSLSTNINGAGKTITKTGAGTLTITDAVSSDYTINTNGGLVILQRSTTKQLKASSINSGGTVRIAANEQFGNNLAVNTGGALEIDAGIGDNVAALSGGGSISGGANSSLGMTGGTFSGSISGDLDLVKTGAGTHTFSGASVSTGNITVSAGTYALSSAGSLTFYIGADGVNNSITGAGAATFDGTFIFDLSAADLLNGNSWLVADVATQSFTSTFVVGGDFNDIDADNIWTNGAGLSFSEATGVLSYSIIPEPSSFAFLGGLASLAACGLRRRRRA